jgi:hypothetical protein
MPLTCKTHTRRLALGLRIQSLFIGRPEKIKLSKLIFWRMSIAILGAEHTNMPFVSVANLIVFVVEYNSKTDNITTTRFQFSLVL